MSAVESKTDITIRPMTRGDIRAVLTLDRQIGRAEGAYPSLSYKDMVATDPGGPLDLSFVAEAGGKVVGFIMTRLAYLMIPFTEVCIIQGILVHPDYREHGIGGRLVQRLLEHCRAEEIGTIRSLVPEGNEELRRFVEAHGFRRSTIVNWDKTFES